MDEKGNAMTKQQMAEIVKEMMSKNKFVTMQEVTKKTGITRHQLYSMEAAGLTPKFYRLNQSQAGKMGRRNEQWASFRLPGTPTK